MVTVPARVQAFINEANALAPGRRKSSDGTYVDKPGDHNVDYRGINHAADLSLSMPDTPYWEPRFEQFDVHGWMVKIAAQYAAASPAVREKRWPWLFDGGYMHRYDPARGVDVIFNPPSLIWTVDNNPPGEHVQHGHFSIGHTVRSENDTQPVFVNAEDDDMTPEQFRKEMDNYRALIKSDTKAVVEKFEERLPDLVHDAIAKSFGGYAPSGSYVDGLLITGWRKQQGVSKPN